MRKPNFTEWAAIAEVIASVAVVISLLFVVYSVNRNTEVTAGAMENTLFEQHAQLANQVMADPSFAEILVKMRADNPRLTEVEAVRWEKYQLNLLDIWAMAFMRHEAGLLAGNQWKAWDDYFTQLFKQGGEKLSTNQWAALEYGYDKDFWLHARKVLFDQ